jgi:raffinose/stachyose/melibiose transport system substrate-binding protein
MMKKKLAILVCAVMTVLMIGSISAIADDGQITLHYMTYSSGDGWTAEQQIIENFQKAYPNIKVETTVVSGTADFITALKTKFAAGEEPDIFRFQGGNRTIEFASAGKLVDLTDEPFMSAFNPKDLELNTYQGRVYAMPLDVQGTGLFVNLDALAQYGDFDLPESFPQLMALCQNLRDLGLEYPLLCAGKDINNVSQVDFQYLATVVWYNNPDYYKEMLEGTRHFTDDWIVQMFNKYEQMREYMSPDVLGVDNDEAIKRFIRGDGVLWVAHSSTITRIRELDPEINFVMVPSVLQDKVEDRVYNVGICDSMQIVNTTEYLDACKQFLEYYISDESVKIFVEVGKRFSAVMGTSYVPDPSLENTIVWMEGDRRIGHADLIWIPGIKDVMKEVTQKWFLGDPLEDVLNEWEAQHQALMEANPEFVANFLSRYAK